MLNHALDSFDQRNCQLLSIQVTSREPVMIYPVNFDGPLGSDDGCSQWQLVSVKFDGGDAGHKQNGQTPLSAWPWFSSGENASETSEIRSSALGWSEVLTGPNAFPWRWPSARG